MTRRQPTLTCIGADTPGFASVAEMLDTTRPDLFFVFSPNAFHLDQIREGLERGIRIFTEKPVVTTLDETFALADLLAKWRHRPGDGGPGPAPQPPHERPAQGAVGRRGWARS